MALLTPKHFTPIYFQNYSQPSDYKGLIEIIWTTMCENHPTHGKYFLGADYASGKTYPFPTKWYLEFTPLKRADFYVRSFIPSSLRVAPVRPVDYAKLIYSIQKPADFDVDAITLNDILDIHAKLSKFMTMQVNEEIEDWKYFFRTHSEKAEAKKDIIRAYSEKTGIAVNTLQQRYKNSPELQKVAVK